MVPVTREAGATRAAAVEAGPADPAAATAGKEKEKEKKEEIEEKQQEPADPKGDPEMAPVYLQTLLPVFTQVYQSTMLPTVR